MTPNTVNNTSSASPTALRINPEAMDALDFKQKIFHRSWVNREDYILERIVDFKSVLHLGCSDAPFTATMIETGKLLHSKLLRRNPNVVGFDLSVAGTQLLKRACPDGKFVCGNAEHLDQHFEPGTFDLIVAGEIVEHLSNPGQFFAACSKILNNDGILLITVPNIFGIRRFIHSLFGVENYHPDHTFYFSENTIGYLAGRFGFSIYRSRYYGSLAESSWLKKVLYFCIETIPATLFGNHFLEGLVIELKKKI